MNWWTKVYKALVELQLRRSEQLLLEAEIQLDSWKDKDVKDFPALENLIQFKKDLEKQVNNLKIKLYALV